MNNESETNGKISRENKTISVKHRIFGLELYYYVHSEHGYKKKRINKRNNCGASTKRVVFFILLHQMRIWIRYGGCWCLLLMFFFISRSLFSSVCLPVCECVQSHCRYNTFENENLTFHLFFAELTTLWMSECAIAPRTRTFTIFFFFRFEFDRLKRTSSTVNGIANIFFFCFFASTWPSCKVVFKTIPTIQLTHTHTENKIHSQLHYKPVDWPLVFSFIPLLWASAQFAPHTIWREILLFKWLLLIKAHKRRSGKKYVSASWSASLVNFGASSFSSASSSFLSLRGTFLPMPLMKKTNLYLYIYIILNFLNRCDGSKTKKKGMKVQVYSGFIQCANRRNHSHIAFRLQFLCAIVAKYS